MFPTAPVENIAKPLYVRYTKPNHDTAWVHVLPGQLRWGQDRWGNGPCWLMECRDAESGAPWDMLLTGIMEVREAPPGAAMIEGRKS